MPTPIYGTKILREFLQEYGDEYGAVEKPIILLGALPLMSSKHAEFLHKSSASH